MYKRTFPSIIGILVLAALTMVGCQSDPDRPTESETDTEITVADTTAPVDPSDVTEPDTPAETETEAETAPVETTEAADGIFESPTRLSGFDQEKNKSFLKGKQCTVEFDDSGALILRAEMPMGKRYAPKLTVEYANMMASCWPSFTKRPALPNGEADKYRAVVITVEGRAEDIEECDLFFTTGKRKTTQNTALPLICEVLPNGRTRLLFDMGASFTEDYLHLLELTWCFGTAQEEMNSEMKLYSIELFPTVEDACTKLSMEAPTTEDVGSYPLEISQSQLNELMLDIFSGNTVKNETVMFLDAGEEKELLYDIEQVLSVTSYDGKKTYREGVDYAVKDGKLVALEGGSIPLITSKRYYGAGSDSLLMTEYNGEKVYTHWGEGQIMTNWQVNVSYTHSDPWDGFEQPCEAKIYADFIRKLQNGEDVTVIYYGDSCTYGAASSFSYGYAPYQYSYTLLVTNALADLFGYTVRYISPNLSGTGPIPNQNYVAGTNGTITYINPSVGGWNSNDALASADTYLLPFVEKYGCDLFVLDIGGNDGSASAENVRRNDEAIIHALLPKAAEDACVIIMTTLVNNPDSVNGWAGTEYLQEPQLRKAAAALRREGIRCGTCCMTSVTRSALEHVNYRDISGNNINHPNDFFARMYACTLFEDLIGYDNLTE